MSPTIDRARLFAAIRDGYVLDWDGIHGADLARALRGDAFDLDDAGMLLLLEACSSHTDWGLTDEPTLGTCWDADRLDLPRCGIIPVPDRLSTVAARDPTLLAWARKRAGG